MEYKNATCYKTMKNLVFKIVILIVVVSISSCKRAGGSDTETMSCTSCGRELLSDQGSSLCESCESKKRFEQERERAAELERKWKKEHVDRNFTTIQNARRISY